MAPASSILPGPAIFTTLVRFNPMRGGPWGPMDEKL